MGGLYSSVEVEESKVCKTVFRRLARQIIELVGVKWLDQFSDKL